MEQIRASTLGMLTTEFEKASGGKKSVTMTLGKDKTVCLSLNYKPVPKMLSAIFKALDSSAHYIEHGDSVYRISKASFSQEIKQLDPNNSVAFNTALKTAATFKEAFSKESLNSAQKQMGRSIKDVDRFFRQHGNELIQQGVSLKTGESGKSAFLHEKKIVLLKSDTGELNVQLRGKKLGRGGFKTVDSLYSLTEKKSFAFAEALENNADTKKNMNKEQRVYEKLTREAGTHEGVKYVLKQTKFEDPTTGSIGLLSERCSGGTLGSLLDAIPERDVAYTLFQQSSAGLAALHEAKMVHLDVKPDNIFLQGKKSGVEARVADFGLAQAVGNPKKGICGTFGYMAPEMFDWYAPEDLSIVGRIKQAVVGPKYTEKMDVFSFGMTMYGFFGDPPIAQEYETGGPAKYHAFVSELKKSGDPLKELIADCVQYDPAKRPTMKEVNERLKALKSEDLNR